MNKVTCRPVRRGLPLEKQILLAKLFVARIVCDNDTFTSCAECPYVNNPDCPTDEQAIELAKDEEIKKLCGMST